VPTNPNVINNAAAVIIIFFDTTFLSNTFSKFGDLVQLRITNRRHGLTTALEFHDDNGVNDNIMLNHLRDIADLGPEIINSKSDLSILKDTSQPVLKDTSQSIVKENKSAKEDKIEFLPSASGKINPACKGYATEDDFFRLRKKMVAENNEEDMVKVAKKVFKVKCFITEYIRNLSTLFLNDQGKYNFFDAAYPYVSDSGVFSTLENQLSDTYYIKRFKAMIHQ